MQLKLELGEDAPRAKRARMSRRSSGIVGGAGIQFGFPDILEPPEETIFFAIHPPRELARETLMQVKSRLSDEKLVGRYLPAERLHVCLLLLCKRNNLPASYLKAVRETVRALRVDAVPVQFDRLSRFGRADQDADSGNWPVVLRGGRNDTALDLSGRLYDGLARVRLIDGGRRPFVPHMTLLYSKVRAIDEPIAPVEWQAEEFSLIRSYHGQSRHEIVETFPLAA